MRAEIPDAEAAHVIRHRFYDHPLHDETYFEAIVSPQYTYDQPATEADKANFPDAWKAYQQGGDQLAHQTRFEMVAWVDDLTAAVLRRHGILTVEQLAGVSDTVIQSLKLESARKMVSKAKQFVADKSSLAETEDLRARLAALEEEMSASKTPPRGKRERRAKASAAA